MLKFKVESDNGLDKLVIQTMETCPTCGRPIGKPDEKVVEIDIDDDLKKLAAKITALSKEKA